MKRFLQLGIILSVCLPLCANSIFYVNHTQQLTLQFPSSIKYVDVGSKEIQLTQMSDNCSLSIRAKQQGVSPTTLSVVTADGNYYLYQLQGADILPYLSYRINKGALDAPIMRIAQQQTTHFIAPFALSDWAVGNDSVIAAYADGIRNMVRVKALHRFTSQSSFTLLGSHGELFSYRLVYSDSVPQLSVQLTDSLSQEAIFWDNPMDAHLLKKLAEKALQQNYTNNHLGVVEHRMQFSAAGIFSYKGWLMLRLQCQNRNNIDYEIDFIKVYIADKKGSKHTALQETEITPFYTYCSDSIVQLLPAQSQQEQVLFFNRFTLPKHRMLYIELFEKNGGRHLQFSISHKELLRAKALTLP